MKVLAKAIPFPLELKKTKIDFHHHEPTHLLVSQPPQQMAFQLLPVVVAPTHRQLHRYRHGWMDSHRPLVNRLVSKPRALGHPPIRVPTVRPLVSTVTIRQKWLLMVRQQMCHHYRRHSPVVSHTLEPYPLLNFIHPPTLQQPPPHRPTKRQRLIFHLDHITHRLDITTHRR